MRECIYIIWAGMCLRPSIPFLFKVYMYLFLLFLCFRCFKVLKQIMILWIKWIMERCYLHLWWYFYNAICLVLVMILKPGGHLFQWQPTWVEGGWGMHCNGTNELVSVLSWDPVGEFWQPVGNLAVARFYHAVLAVPTSTVNLYCTKKMEFNKINKDSPLFCMFSHVQCTESPKMYLTRYHHI